MKIARRACYLAVAMVAIVTNPCAVAAADKEKQTRGYQAIEVAPFAVDRNSYSTKEAERAARISQDMLEAIQLAILGQLTRSSGLLALRPGETVKDPGRRLLLSGKVTDFKPGNRLARYMIGFGAGKQLIEAECVLTDKDTGEILSQKRIIDRKVGGWAGGSEDKGIENFAEKVLHFVKDSLSGKATK